MNLIPETLKRPGRLVALVVGGTDYDDEYVLWNCLDLLLAEADERDLGMVVINGHTNGAAALARVWATNNDGVLLVNEQLSWKASGQEEGIRRMEKMLAKRSIDLCVTVPGGPGTDYIVKRCQEIGIPVIEA